MTREEAIEELERLLRHWDDLENDKRCFWGYDKEAVALALSALRPVSRERVERIRGEWVAKHRHWGCFRRVTGVDDMGERRTITIDERCEYDDRYCSKCGKRSLDSFLNFCGYCGAPMTDEAVDIIMRRLETLYETT